jgi:hypothetical protein
MIITFTELNVCDFTTLEAHGTNFAVIIHILGK